MNSSDNSSNRKKNKNYKNNKSAVYKNTYCGNCGKHGHVYKNCKEPVISYGVIVVKIDQNNDENSLSDIFKEFTTINSTSIQCNNYSDTHKFSLYRNIIQFLMIRRKHTLGYIEFIRGRYRIDNVDGIIFLFQQMTKEEIEKIGTLEFDDLWNEMWSNDMKNNSHDIEYKQSKEKFNKLKFDEGTDLNLKFYVKSIVPKWDQAEWGFPKGRRNHFESNVECATREFEEETGLNEKDYTLLKNIEPIEEELIGTNGIRYKHVYYIALSNSKIDPKIDIENKHQKEEIGDIGFFTYDESIKLIRPYHIERRKIMTMLYMYFINSLINCNKV